LVDRNEEVRCNAENRLSQLWGSPLRGHASRKDIGIHFSEMARNTFNIDKRWMFEQRITNVFKKCVFCFVLLLLLLLFCFLFYFAVDETLFYQFF